MLLKGTRNQDSSSRRLRLMRKMELHKAICICFILFVGYSIVFADYSSPTTSPYNPIISVAQLKNLLKKSAIKIIDATYSGKSQIPEVDQKIFYGKFENLSKQFAEAEYKKEHIAGAVSLSLDVGFYPGKYKRYDLYPPKVFEVLLRKLGINNGDRIVVYGRGPFSGMLYAAHVWWLLKLYGIENVQVLNGGLDAWKRDRNPVSNEEVQVKEGNFKAVANPKFLITFEELEARDAQGGALIDHLEAVNAFDGRPNAQYTGEAKINYKSSGVITGSHIRGAKSLPVADLINENGLKPPNEIRRLLERAGYVHGRPVITYCNVGNQASLLLLALHSLGINDIKLYQGGMTEMALRDPGRIS